APAAGRGRAREWRRRFAPGARARCAPAPPAARDSPPPPATCAAGGSASTPACDSGARGRLGPVPDFQVQKRPQQFFVSLAALVVLVEHAVQDLGFIVGPRQRRRAGEVIARSSDQLAAQRTAGQPPSL